MKKIIILLATFILISSISITNADTPNPTMELPKTNLTGKIYKTEAELLKAEPTCTYYTDGCNTIS
jgi:hypothetical protein